jgi:hypothetical protein
MYISTLPLTSALDGVGGQRHVPAALPPEKTQYPLYRRLGGTQGRSGRVGKISPLPGFEPRTVQAVTSRYTDWAIAAHSDITLYRKTLRTKDKMISQNSALLGHYEASSGNSLPTFRDYLSIPSSWEMGPIGCREALVRNYHYSLRNSPEEPSCSSTPRRNPDYHPKLHPT